MFDNSIEMGMLAQAYNLDATECVALAQKIPCRFGTVEGLPISDIANIDAYAKRYAKHIMETDPQQKTLFVWTHTLFCWRGWNYEKAEKEWASDYKAFLDVGNIDEALFRFWSIVRLYFITDLTIEKKDMAVRLLHENGYSLRQEVKGLSRAYVDGILSSHDTKTEPQQPPVETEAIAHQQSATGQESPFTNGGTPEAVPPVPVNIPASLWAGKTPQAIFSALNAHGYEDGLIALVINEKCVGTKADKGRPFLPEGSDESVYRRKIDSLVEQATQRYALTFNG